MPDLTNRLGTVLELLPVAVGFASTTGHYIRKAGGMSKLLGDMVPSRDERKTSHWIMTDAAGAILSRNEWPDARALRGDRSCTASFGRYHDEEGERQIKEMSVSTLDPRDPVAAVTFLQVMDSPTRSIDGSHFDLQQRLMEELAGAVARGWSTSALAADLVSAVNTPTPR